MTNRRTISANRSNSQKEAARKRPQTWKPGQSGNPNGAPKRGQSWKEIIDEIGNLTGPEIAARWDTQNKEFRRLPDNVTLKELCVMAVFAAMLREPSPGLWRELMERAEGRVRESVELTGAEGKDLVVRVIRASDADTRDRDQ